MWPSLRLPEVISATELIKLYIDIFKQSVQTPSEGAEIVR